MVAISSGGSGAVQHGAPNGSRWSRWRWPALLDVVALFGLAVAFPSVMLVRLMLQSQRFRSRPGHG